jgi:hypothetical protein
MLSPLRRQERKRWASPKRASVQERRTNHQGSNFQPRSLSPARKDKKLCFQYPLSTVGCVACRCEASQTQPHFGPRNESEASRNQARRHVGAMHPPRYNTSGRPAPPGSLVDDAGPWLHLHAIPTSEACSSLSPVFPLGGETSQESVKLMECMTVKPRCARRVRACCTTFPACTSLVLPP